MNLPTYKNWSPTHFDSKGKCLGTTIDDDRGEWLVAPCILTRDSDALARANWKVISSDLETFVEDVERLNFGHWACGWFEIILCKPDSQAAHKAAQWAERLEDYPVADEQAFMDEETEDNMYNGWSSYETWNVALWIGNDEGLYQLARSTRSFDKFKTELADAGVFRTPDGVDFDDPAVDEDEIATVFEEIAQ